MEGTEIKYINILLNYGRNVLLEELQVPEKDFLMRNLCLLLIVIGHKTKFKVTDWLVF